VKLEVATVIVPVLVDGFGFESTLKFTVPFPGPVPEVIWMKLLLVDGVHAQVAPAVTLNDPVPPANGIRGELVGDKL